MKAKAFFGFFILLLTASQAYAGSPPVIGDAWVYRLTFRALDDPMAKVMTRTVFTSAAYLNTMGKLVFSGNMAGFGMYSNTCLFDVAAGEELAGEIPCDEPLPVGMSWRAALRDPTKGTEESLAVLEMNEIKIGSHTYLASVIRTERALTPWDNLGHNPNLTRRRATYWYVSEIKGMAKIVHELLDAAGQPVTRQSYELLHFYPVLENTDE